MHGNCYQSTVPAGTSVKVKKTVSEDLERRGKNIEFDVASNPEILKEGSAVDDFLKPDMIVIGTESFSTGVIFMFLLKWLKWDLPIKQLEVNLLLFKL